MDEMKQTRTFILKCRGMKTDKCGYSFRTKNMSKLNNR